MTAQRFCFRLVPVLLAATLSASAQQRAALEEAEKYFQQGLLSFDSEEWQMSESFFDSCTNIQPDHIDAHFYKAMTREYLDDPEGAITEYGILIHLDPNFSEALWRRATLRYKIHRFELAYQDFIRLLEVRANGQTETNAVFFKQKYPDDAISGVGTLETMEAEIHNHLGLTAGELTKNDLALDHFATAIQLDPSNADAYVNRAGLFETEGKLILAENDLRKALEIDPTHTAARYNLANLMESSPSNGASAELVETYTAIIKENPAFSEAFAKRGLARLDLGDLEGALNDYDSAIIYNSYNHLLWLNRGIIEMRLENFNNALRDLSRSLEIRPDQENAYLNRGNVYMKIEAFDRAEKDYNLAIFYYPEFPLAYYNRAIARYNQGRKELGCEDMQRALDLGMSQAEDTFARMCR